MIPYFILAIADGAVVFTFIKAITKREVPVPAKNDDGELDRFI